MKFITMKFFPWSVFLPLRSKYPPQHTVIKILSLCSSLKVRDQVSHPYSTTGKITVYAKNCIVWTGKRLYQELEIETDFQDTKLSIIHFARLISTKLHRKFMWNIDVCVTISIIYVNVFCDCLCTGEVSAMDEIFFLLLWSEKLMWIKFSR
jgi:hypothetical protein